MDIHYFAWVRERTGTSQEQVDPPATVATVHDLMRWLADRSPGHAEAFRESTMIRAAVNHETVPFTHPVSAGDEVAFFPPMTGG